VRDHVVLLSAGQPSSNPRLVKEAVSLVEKGYKVAVLYCYWTTWAEKGDEQLFREYPSIDWIRVGGHPVHKKGLYWFTRLRHRWVRFLSGIFPGNLRIQQGAYIRCFYELKSAATRCKAALYIAHNLGALAPAALAASGNKTLFGFDAEDYYRGQSSDDSSDAKKAILIENAYIRGGAYHTAASPLIAARYEEHYPGIRPVVINNVFSLQFLQAPPAPYLLNEELKLFWFSQTVGTGRGLEEVIVAMGKVKTRNISCTILGSCSTGMKTGLLSVAASNGVLEQQLRFVEPVLLPEIFRLAADHHIGLATETGMNLNNEIALSNKILSYPLAGAAIVASDTSAQRLFLEAHPGTGQLYKRGNTDGLAGIFDLFMQNPEELNAARQNAYDLAKRSLNWEYEKEAFLEIIKGIV